MYYQNKTDNPLKSDFTPPLAIMAEDEKKDASDKNDHRRLHSFPLIRVSYTPIIYYSWSILSFDHNSYLSVRNGAQICRFSRVMFKSRTQKQMNIHLVV